MDVALTESAALGIKARCVAFGGGLVADRRVAVSAGGGAESARPVVGVTPGYVTPLPLEDDLEDHSDDATTLALLRTGHGTGDERL